MFGIHDFGVFLAASILLNLTPGPDTLYILGRGVAQGRSAAVASALGISAGSLVHTIFAALGLSALIATSALAFAVVKFAGAAYLIYLGLRMLLARKTSADLPAQFATAEFPTIFRQGMLTNILNPKVALFFLAFMPQFIAADTPSKLAAFLTLGFTFVTTGTIWCLCLAWFSAAIGSRLRSNSTIAENLNRAAGAIFIALGLRLATSK